MGTRDDLLHNDKELGTEDAVSRSDSLTAEEKNLYASFETAFSGPHGAYNLVNLLGKCNISLELLQKARDICIDKPFSNCKYSDMARFYGFHPYGVWQDIGRSVDAAEDELGTLCVHVNENTRSLWIAAWFRPLVALFKSRFRNMPERTIAGHHRTRGGMIELQYWIEAQCPLVVVEVKSPLSVDYTGLDALAHLLAELDAADFRNRKETLAVPTVRGILTDGTRFRFVDFAPGSVKLSGFYLVDYNSPAEIATSMKPICEIFFASLLSGWSNGLPACRSRSEKLGELTGVRQPSTAQWVTATTAASQAFLLAKDYSHPDKTSQGRDVIKSIDKR
ncbi:hypothetical protein HKX48_006012 [Thoreauomyces humboldtii]|nr:hypothetical protein HKX48_006012 [Thoreauomyces humboldtii]